ncbi:MAG: hemerythrin domain-containing protein [Acidobacteriota bacterium]
MNLAIDTLMHEHRVIEQVLSALDGFAAGIDRGEPADRATVRDFADFFANFADKCHHGKEEDRLFARMTDHGFPRDAGPIGVMLAEHTAGRQHVGALRSIGEGTGPLSEADRRAICFHAGAYVPLLRQHIVKEDSVLYPMAVRAIPEGEFERMAQDFEAFERTVMGEGEHERFHALADRLIARFAPVQGPGTTPQTASCHHRE